MLCMYFKYVCTLCMDLKRECNVCVLGYVRVLCPVCRLCMLGLYVCTVYRYVVYVMTCMLSLCAMLCMYV